MRICTVEVHRMVLESRNTGVVRLTQKGQSHIAVTNTRSILVHTHTHTHSVDLHRRLVRVDEKFSHRREKRRWVVLLGVLSSCDTCCRMGDDATRRFTTNPVSVALKMAQERLSPRSSMRSMSSDRILLFQRRG